MIVIVVIVDTFSKAFFSISFNVVGKYTLDSLPQPEKVPSATELRPSENVTSLIDAQVKAYFPMVYGVEDCIVTLSKLPHPIKARSPIADNEPLSVIVLM